MAATLPLNIPIPQSAAIASFNYTDIAEGTGVVAFYGSVHSESGTAGYYLTTNTPSSNQVIVSGATLAAGVDGYVSQNNFDIKFNRPQNIKGYAYLNITIGGYHASAGGSSPVLFISGGTLKNATTGVTLATATSDTFNVENTAGDVNVYSKTMNIQFDLTGGPYHFKAGDILRLTPNLWGGGGSTSALIYAGYGADPKDRNDPDTRTVKDADTTQMVLYIPFLLNTV